MIEAPYVPLLTDQELASLERRLFDEPRHASPWRPVIARMTVGVAAAAAFGALSLTGSGGSAAFAGWTAVPTPATPAQTARAAALCRETGSVRAGEQVVVAERRGPAAFLVFASSLDSTSCLLDHPDAAGPEAGVGGIGGGVDPDAVALTRPAGARVDVLAGAGQSDGRSDELTAVYGRSGPDVRSIVVVRTDGRTVTAEVAPDGWWSAWWPGSDVTPKAVRVTGTNGLVTVGPVPWVRR